MDVDLIVFVRSELRTEIKRLISGDMQPLFVESIDGLVKGLNEKGPAIILIDREYSNLNAEMVGTLRAIFPDAIKLVLTEHPDLDMVMEFINSGAIFGFVQIPIDPVMFRTLMDRALATVRARIQNRLLLEKVRRFDSDLGVLLMKRLQSLEEENRALKQQVILDPLTQCFNVRYMRYQLSLEYDKFLRYGEIFSVLMLDLDDFKSINDNYGHQIGDMALISAASVLKKSVRASDVVIRYGGDEFMVIAPNTGRKGVVKMAERINSGIKGVEIDTDKGKLGLSVSIGAVTCEKADDAGVNELVRRADKALYHAKHAGKQKVAVWHDIKGELEQ